MPIHFSKLTIIAFVMAAVAASAFGAYLVFLQAGGQQNHSTQASPKATPTLSLANGQSPTTSPSPTQTPTTSPTLKPLPTATPKPSNASNASSGANQAASSTPSPTSTPSPIACPNSPHTPGGSDGLGGCWPGSNNTGIPSGTVLGTYTGPCTLTSGNSGPAVTITQKDANACGILAVYDVNVTIVSSRVPVIDRTNSTGSVHISNSELRGEGWVGGVLWGSNITAIRVNITGGQHSVHCEANCTILDSWLHSQEAPAGQATHNNAFISNGGSNMVVRHNSLFCSAPDNGAGGGCTADASIFGDFANLATITFDKNLFVATNSGGYCGSFGYNPSKTYGSNPTNISVTNNVFGRGSNLKCGVYGPVTSFIATGGNTWLNNRYADGITINP